MDNIRIDLMRDNDWNQVKAIYIEGIETGNATFEASPPTWKTWNENHLQDFRLVVRGEHGILGWAALSPYSKRAVYSGVAEVSIYITSSALGKGIGSKLLSLLILQSEEKNIWTLQAGIFPENIASLKLHKKHGFREVGRREKIGKMNDIWRDVILLERRKKES